MILGRGFWKHAVVAFVLWVLCWAVYHNSLHNDFMIDDHGMVLQDTKIHNPKFFFYQFIPDLQKNLSLEGSKGDVYYRPLAHVLPMAGYLWFGSDPFGYHLLNLILFYLCAMAFYGFWNLLLKDGSLAFLTTLFFCAHPINALLVNYITASVFSVQVLSMTASLALVLIASDESGFRRISERRRGLLYFLSLIFFGISLLCHETAAVFPLYLAACLWFSRPYSFKKVLTVCSPFLITVGLYLVFRWEHASLKTSLLEKIPLGDLSWAGYIATFTRLVVCYLE